MGCIDVGAKSATQVILDKLETIGTYKENKV
jgi:hypothetical protein